MTSSGENSNEINVQNRGARDWTVFFFIASVALFLLSLPLPGFYSKPERLWPSVGFVCVLFGWGAVVEGYGWAWLANPLLVVIWLNLRRFRRGPSFPRAITAIVCSIAALVLALSFLLEDTLPVVMAPNPSSITGIGLAYVLWLCSIIAATLGSIAALVRYARRGNLTQTSRREA